MCDIADDGDAQAVETAAAVDDRKRIEEGLRRMLMRSVAGVHDGNGQVTREEMRGSRGGVAHHDCVRAHGAEGVQSIDEGFAFRNAGTGGSDGENIGSEAPGSDLKAGAGAGGGFKEEIDDGAAAQSIEPFECLAGGGLEEFRPGQNGFDVVARERFDIKQAGRHGQLAGACAASSRRSTSMTFSCPSISWNFTSMISLSLV